MSTPGVAVIALPISAETGQDNKSKTDRINDIMAESFFIGSLLFWLEIPFKMTSLFHYTVFTIGSTPCLVWLRFTENTIVRIPVKMNSVNAICFVVL